MLITSWFCDFFGPKICMLKDDTYRPSVGPSKLRNRQKGTREGLIIRAAQPDESELNSLDVR